MLRGGEVKSVIVTLGERPSGEGGATAGTMRGMRPSTGTPLGNSHSPRIALVFNSRPIAEAIPSRRPPKEQEPQRLAPPQAPVPIRSGQVPPLS